MGMFDKDKLYGGTPLEKWIQPGQDFILHGARIATEEFPLDDGNKATKCELFVARTETPTDVVKVSTLSSVTADKVKDAEPNDGTSGDGSGDFPAICQFQTVQANQESWNDAKVVRFIRPGDSAWISEYEPDDVPDGADSSGADQGSGSPTG